MIVLTIPRPELDSKALRERELVARMQSLDAELEQLETEITDFRRANFGFSNGEIFIIGDAMTVRAAVDCQARTLAQRMDRLRTARNDVLHELAYL